MPARPNQEFKSLRAVGTPWMLDAPVGNFAFRRRRPERSSRRWWSPPSTKHGTRPSLWTGRRRSCMPACPDG